MVCPRCVMAVEQTLTKLNIPFSEVNLGEVIVETEQIDYTLLDKELKSIGFELINDDRKITLEQIKTLIIDFIHHNENEKLKINFLDYISKNIKKDYQSLSRLFSELEGITIKKYITLQKIEKVKELITYNELNFSEIAYKMNYSSAAHLTNQFKSITGLTLTEYKNSKIQNRQTLDKV